jgi:hypothetical protein
MKTEQITIRVDTDAANAYRNASDEDRRKLDLLLSLRLRDAMQTSRSLTTILAECSARARGRGLTEEALRALLDAE